MFHSIAASERRRRQPFVDRFQVTHWACCRGDGGLHEGWRGRRGMHPASSAMRLAGCSTSLGFFGGEALGGRWGGWLGGGDTWRVVGETLGEVAGERSWGVRSLGCRLEEGGHWGVVGRGHWERSRWGWRAKGQGRISCAPPGTLVPAPPPPPRTATARGAVGHFLGDRSSLDKAGPNASTGQQSSTVPLCLGRFDSGAAGLRCRCAVESFAGLSPANICSCLWSNFGSPRRLISRWSGRFEAMPWGTTMP